MVDNLIKEDKEEVTVEKENISSQDTQSQKKHQFDETVENIRKNEKIEDLYNYARSNTGDTVAYVAMIVGLLILFFEPFFGGSIIGIVAGLYFSKEIMRPIRHLEDFIEQLGMVRSLLFGGILLAFFIKLPMVFIAAAITVGLKQLFYQEKNKNEEPPTNIH